MVSKDYKINIFARLILWLTVILCAYLKYLGIGFILFFFWYIYVVVYLFHLIVQEYYLWFLRNNTFNYHNKFKISYISNIIFFVITLFTVDCRDDGCKLLISFILGSLGDKSSIGNSDMGGFVQNFILLLLIVILNIFILWKIARIKKNIINAA